MIEIRPWRRLIGIVTLAAAMAVPATSFAERAASSGYKFDVGVGTWISVGDTRWAHDASEIPGFGNPTSKLVYKDVGTNILELTGKLTVGPRFFGRLNVGFGEIGGGRLTDEDFATGQQLAIRTFSNLPDNGMWYLNADVGAKVGEFPNHRGFVEVFAGYQYWHTKYQATGIGVQACDPALLAPATCPSDQPANGTVITNTTNWHSIRLGTSAEYRLTRRISLLGTVAFIPLSVIDNKDIHHLRPDLQQDPSISMVGVGIGADADVGLRLAILRNLFLNVGYRVWYNRALDGTVKFHAANGAEESFPLEQFQSLRHGLTAGINLTF